MWIAYAFLSALSAALVAIFAKEGLQTIDSIMATTIRAVVMVLFLLMVSITMNKFDGFSLHSLSGRDWMFIVLAGIAGAFSWLFYFWALQKGPASGVVAIDRTSIVMVVILAAIFLGEVFTWKAGLGALLMIGGMVLIAL